MSSLGAVQVWQADDGKLLFEASRSRDFRNNGGLRVALDAQGSTVIAISSDNSVKIWDVNSGKELVTLRGHELSIRDFVLTRDGQRLTTISSDKTAKVWGHHLWPRIDDPGKTSNRRQELPLTARASCSPLAQFERHRSRVDQRADSGGFRQPLQQVWLEQQVAVNESAGRWFAAAFYLDSWVTRKPDDAEVRMRRGRALAESGQWDRAIADFAAAAASTPNKGVPRYALGVAYLAAGKSPQYRRVCEQALGDFAASSDPASVNAVARLGTLTPGAIEKAQQLVELAEVPVLVNPKLWHYTESLGAARYRAGQFKEAVAALDKASKQRPGGGTIQTKLYLVMAHHRLDHADTAKTLLGEALAAAEKAGALVWNQRVEIDLLRREAEALVGEKRIPPNNR